MPRIIDAWIQHPSREFMQLEMFDSLRRWQRMAEVPEKFPVEATIAAMDTCGVTQALVSAWYGPHGPLLSNDFVADCVAKFPDRLVGICSVNLSKPMDAVRDLRRCVKERGFKGLRLLPWLWQLPPNDRRYYPLYAECIELGVPFCLQVGHAGPLCPSDPGRPIPYLDEVACEFPELKIVGGHIGYPWTQEMIALATKYPNVYIDTSAYKPSRYPPEFVQYLKAHGGKKILFGSNYPMIQPGECLREVDSLELSEETRNLFLWGNAARVFGLE
jgi:predicted TIM-barrel fold metal-dependent hydrolase